MGSLLRILSSYFCAGLVVTRGRVTEAAPILSYTVGWTERRVWELAVRKGWEVEEIVADLFNVKKEYFLVDSPERWTQLLQDIKNRPQSIVGYDSETTGLDYRNIIVGASIATAPGRAYYLPFRHRVGVNYARVKPAFFQIMQKLPSVAANAAYDWKEFIWEHTPDHDFMATIARGQVPNITHDVMCQFYLLDGNASTGLKQNTLRYFGHKMTEFEELFPSKKAAQTMKFWDLDSTRDDILNYACEDADYALRHHLLHYDRIQKEYGPLYRIENALWPVLAKMEMRGIVMDPHALEEPVKILKEEVERWRQEAFRLGGREFEINSPAQVGVLLFDELKLPEGKRTKTGRRSTEESVLEKLAEDYPVAAAIMSAKKLFKLLNSFLAKLPGDIKEDGAIHTSFLQCHVSTGRLASAGPNLQQIPKRGNTYRMRSAFKPRPGYYLVDADYAQVEYRILVSKANCQSMMVAFDRGEDFHALNARNIFNLKNVSQVTSEQRDVGKTVNFALLYGMEEWSLARKLKISPARASEIMSNYFSGMPEVERFIEAVHADVQRTGYVKTHFGRKRELPEVWSSDRKTKGFGLRSAVNTIVQGTAADLMRIALVRLEKLITPFGGELLLSIHDQAVAQIPEGVPYEQACAAFQEAMEIKIPGWCTLPIEIKVGWNWEDKASSWEDLQAGNFGKKSKEAQATAPSLIASDMSAFSFPSLHCQVERVDTRQVQGLRDLLASFPVDGAEEYAFYLHLEGQVIKGKTGFRYSEEFLEYLERVLPEGLAEVYNADGARTAQRKLEGGRARGEERA